MDPTLFAILVVLLVATVVGVLQARRRDKCLRHFDGYRVTFAETDGDLVWGDLDVLATGCELRYVAPVHTDQGHLETSFLLFKDQYPDLHAIYRYPLGLTEEQRERRAEDLRQTVRPSLGRRIRRVLRNWISMVRDAVVQAFSLIIGMAKARTPRVAVLAGQENSIKSLSSEIIGYVGTAYDPLLERHLFDRVVVEVTREGRREHYCGWLKDYSTGFIELLDAVVNDREGRPVTPLRPGDDAVPGVRIHVEGRRLAVVNTDAPLVYVREVTQGDWRRPLDVVVSKGHTADVMLPPGVLPDEVEVGIGTAQRVDLIVPRAHAIVRHSALLLPSPARPEKLTDEEAAHTVSSVVPEAESTEDDGTQADSSAGALSTASAPPR